MDDLMAARLMKQGRFDELTDYLTERETLSKTEETFISYMDRMIEKSGMSRSTIVQRAGLSKDYMYKVLRGDKKTTERDYLIAFCLAMKMSLPQLQHALELYPFPPLDSKDNRSYLISVAFTEGISMDGLNEALDKVGYPMLRISPEMPTAKVGPIRSTPFTQNDVNSLSDEGPDSSKKRRFIRMKAKNTTVLAEQVGMAPVDIAISAEIELEHDHGKTVYAQALFAPDYSFFAIDETSMYKEEYLEHSKQIEFYEALEDASESEYFLYFIELDKLTDQKAAEELKRIDDTKYCPSNLRAGQKIDSDGKMIYAESFNNTQPERNEYLQIRQWKHKILFSVSHKSYYLQYELGPVYEAYFPKPDKQLYVLETSDLDELKESGYLGAFVKMFSIINGKAKIEDFN